MSRVRMAALGVAAAGAAYLVQRQLVWQRATAAVAGLRAAADEVPASGGRGGGGARAAALAFTPPPLLPPAMTAVWTAAVSAAEAAWRDATMR